MCVKVKHAKFQPSSARGTFSNCGLNGEGKKNVRFPQKTGHILEPVIDTGKVSINY